MTRRTAQITVFVLIGVILLLGVLGAAYLLPSNAESETGGQETGSSFDEAITPVTSEIRRCTNDLVNDRVRDLAIQGGLTDEEAGDLRTGLTRDAYRSEGIDYYGDNQVIVPYWSYSPSDPDCTTCESETRITPLTGEDSFQQKTEQYVENNIRSCLDDFQQFKDTLRIEAGQPDATVRFNAQDTTTALDWAVTATDKATGNTYEVDTVEAQTELPLRPVYEAAVDSLRKIESSQLPETYVQKLIAYLSLDEQIPSVKGGISVGLDSDVWVRDDVRSTLQQSLANYASLINLVGENQTVPTYRSREVARFSKDLLLTTSSPYPSQYDIEANIRPSWPVFLRVDGSESPIITPDTTSFGLKFLRFGFTNNDFTYDVSYPMTVDVTDSSGPGDPLTLRFGVEGNIRNSQSYDERTYRAASSGQTSLDLSGLGANNVTVTIDGPTTEDGAIQFDCAGETITQGDRNPEQQGHQVQLPTCTDGSLSYQASLLQSNTINTSIPADDQSLTLETRELQAYNVSVARRPVFNLDDPSTNLSYTPSSVQGVQDAVSPTDNNIDGMQAATYVPATIEQDPLPRENVTVVFSQVDGDYAASTTFNADTTQRSIDLFPGEYTTQVFAEYSLSTPIQTQPEQICNDGGFFGGSECQIIPGQSIPGGQDAAVRRCVEDRATDAELQSFLDALNASESPALSVAEEQGYNVQGCVDEQLSNRDLSIATGGFIDANNSITIPRDARQIKTPYFGYHPSQINVTRDMRIMSSVLQLAGQTREFDQLQPQVS